ncbi:unnamed protein product [Lactuca saligna]|uniref:Uncharacterized protein n=1 Tax=Lactuca saligna TaxID=75948 RepID=A0AA35ZMT8_LACSI|nr:unnamed protein product [Lactuca saligna]
MAIKLFVGIFFGFLMYTSDIARGRKLVERENQPLVYAEASSKIGCSTTDMICGGGNKYIRKESLKENNGGMFVAGIGISSNSDNGERTKKIQGRGCTNGEVGCNDLSRRNRNNKKKIYFENKSNANKNDYLNIEKNTVIANNRNNENNNGSHNNIGNRSGSNNGAVNGKVSQNGNETVNGNGSGNNNSVGIGDDSGKGNNSFNYSEGSSRDPNSS